MTEDPAPQPTAAPADAAPPDLTATGKPPVKKSSPRRKVGTRSKAAVVVEGTDDAAVTIPKVRRPRKKTAADDASPDTDTAPAPAAPPAQPEMLSASALEQSPSPEARVETQVIRPDTFRRLEERSARQFGHGPGGTAPADRVAPPDAFAGDGAPDASGGLPPAPAPRFPEPATGRGDANQYPRQDPSERPQNRPEYRQDRPDYRQDGQNRQGRQDGQNRQGPPNFQPQGHQPYPRQDRNDRFNRYDRQNRQDRQDRQQGPGGGQGGQSYPPQSGQPYPGQDGGEPAVSRVVEPQFGEGIVEVSGKGFGFLREAKRNFVQTPADVFVTPEVCRQFNLRDGQWIKGEVRRSSRGPQLFRLTELNGVAIKGEDPKKYHNLPNFEELTTINPKKRIKLETVPERYTTRVMDLMTPIGKGQRGLLVAPPRTGKTTLLQHIAEAVIKNHPEMKIIILLVDERPEEVTEMRRTVPQAEIMASSNDSDLKSHTRIAQLAMERSKRLVEAGFDVFMLLDSITRMGRAFNNTSTGSRTGSGGIDSRALEIPRKIFAAARNTEEAGSLTIMATALIETGSRGDEVIFQEFKGTGNMELVLDRKISDQRIYPAVDIFQSGTRREELLLQPWELDKINVIRRGLAGHKPLEAIERLLSFLKKFPTNVQMLTSLPG